MLGLLGDHKSYRCGCVDRKTFPWFGHLTFSRYSWGIALLHISCSYFLWFHFCVAAFVSHPVFLNHIFVLPTSVYSKTLVQSLFVHALWPLISRIDNKYFPCCLQFMYFLWSQRYDIWYLFQLGGVWLSWSMCCECFWDLSWSVGKEGRGYKLWVDVLASGLCIEGLQGTLSSQLV